MSRHKDAAFGFEVWGELLRARMYTVIYNPTINIYHGDVVKHGAAALDTGKMGFMQSIDDSAVPDANDNLLGVVIAIMDEDMDPVPYIAAADQGDGTICGFVMVADHPDQEFVVQEDCNTTPIALASAGKNVEVQSQTFCAGTAATGRSLQELDSDTVGTTAALDVKLHYPHPEDIVPGTEGTWHPRWIVTINSHHFGDTIAGL